MRFRLAAAVLTFAALVAAAPVALAKAPKASEVPTIEELWQQAKAAQEELVQRAAEAKRDPFKEAIDAYRKKDWPREDYEKLVDILNDAKDPKMQPYRAAAADALVERFQAEALADPEVRQVRREIALKIVDLMKAPKTDDVGLQIVARVFQAWWPAKLSELGWAPGDKPADRRNAHRGMKKYLEKGERD